MNECFDMTKVFYGYLEELRKRGFTVKEIERLIERFNYSKKSRNKVFDDVRHMILWRK